MDYKPNILMMIGIHKKSGNLDGFYQLAATGRATPTINYIYIYILFKKIIKTTGYSKRLIMELYVGRYSRIRYWCVCVYNVYSIYTYIFWETLDG